MALVVVVWLAALTLAPVAWACSCAMIPTPQLVANADLIARVRVTAVDRSQVGGGSADPVIYTVAASRVWKGTPAPAYRFASAASGASCGVEGFEVGTEILLFARGNPSWATPIAATPWWADRCNGTGPVDERLREVVGVLGAGVAVSAPTPTQSATPLDPGPTAAPEPGRVTPQPVAGAALIWGLVAGGIGLLIVLVAVGARKRRS